MNKKRILLGLLGAGGRTVPGPAGICQAASSKPHPHPSSHSAIDAYVEEQRRRLHIPGISLAIIEGDRIAHYRSFGLARQGGEAPSPQTPFFIGSLTKSFTALAVMQLVEAGKVELDAPVQRYLPWFRVADPQASAQMTVRHLLNQTSGLPALPGEIALADFDDRPDATERQVRALASLKITRPVGSKCEYSNLNYNILGLIVEAASGESYADYVQTHIFNPAGNAPQLYFQGSGASKTAWRWATATGSASPSLRRSAHPARFACPPASSSPALKTWRTT